MKKSPRFIYFILLLLAFTIFNACDPDAPLPPSSAEAKSISAFMFTAADNDVLNEDAAGTITDFSIFVIVPDGIDLRTLKPSIIYDAAAIYPGNLVVRDFSNPADYIVMAEDGTASHYSVTVAHESEVAALKTITSFVFKASNNPGLSGDIAGTVGGAAISLTVPYGTDVSALVPTIVHTGKSIVPVNESARSFYSPQTYTVTAGDGSTSDYTVTVTVSSPPGTVSLIETGQSTSYLTGDDGDLKAGAAWPVPRFTDNGNSTITDNATGLIWEKYPSNTIMTWEEALAYCNDLILGGSDDWRLSNINELVSLLNLEEASMSTWLNSLDFDSIIASNYWSSTTWEDITTSAICYRNTNNDITSIDKGNDCYLIAVRGVSTVVPATGQTSSHSATGGEDGDLQAGVAWPSPRFEVSGNVIIDNLTGLMWEQAPTTAGLAWDAAIADANNSPLDGYDDWRLPNLSELRSLANYGLTDAAAWLNSEGFTNIGSGFFYYTSTTSAGNDTYAWVQMLDDGTGSSALKTNAYRVIHVRAGD